MTLIACQDICKNLIGAAVWHPESALRFSRMNYAGRSEFVILTKIISLHYFP